MTRGVQAVPLALCVLFLFSGAAGAQISDNKTRVTTQRQEQHRSERALNAEQKASSAAILSKYKPETLTADDARKIRKSLRDAGLRGRQIDEALTSAGFDPAKMRELRPAPRHDKMPPGPGPDFVRRPVRPATPSAAESKVDPASSPESTKASCPAAAATAAKPAAEPAAADKGVKQGGQ